MLRAGRIGGVGARTVEPDSEDSATLGVDSDVSWTMNDEAPPRSEMSWASESGGFKRVGRGILTGFAVSVTMYTVFAVKD